MGAAAASRAAPPARANPRARHAAPPLGRLRSRCRAAALIALFGAAALSGCSQFENIHPFDGLSKVDWSAEWERINQPAPLGRLIDRKPPAVAIRATGPYPGPLSDAAPPLLTAELADAMVAAPFRAGLTPSARLDLAQASVLAAAAATGTAISWKAADAQGIVTPARDVYISHHGLVCRDLRQTVQKAGAAVIAPMTLCREDDGGGGTSWRPAMED
jgi:surface antigen